MSTFRDESAVERYSGLACTPYAMAQLHCLTEKHNSRAKQAYIERATRLQEVTHRLNGFQAPDVKYIDRILREDYQAELVEEHLYIGDNHPVMDFMEQRPEGLFFLIVGHGDGEGDSHCIVINDGELFDNHTIFGLHFMWTTANVYKAWRINSLPYRVTPTGTYDAHGMWMG